MESMTIACTRCGATCEGDIILPPIAFTFKHKTGCGHGVGPLAVLPGSKKKTEKKAKTFPEQVNEQIIDEIAKEVKKEEIKVEEKVEEPKFSKKKFKVFSKKD